MATVFRDIPDRATLDREYSPSSCVPDIMVFITAYIERSAEARRLHGDVRTVVYGPDEEERIDLFLPAGVQTPPLMVFIHGGYWQELSKSEASAPATGFNAQGVAYAAVNYGLAPKATLAEMVERCRRAIAHLHRDAANLGFDPDRIYVSGSSAGAHLAAMTTLTDWSRLAAPSDVIKGAIFLSGVFDLRAIPLTYVNDPLGLDQVEAMRLSPLLLVDGTPAVLPPTVVAWGEHETGEFKRMSRDYAEALKRRGVAVNAFEAAGRNHFDILFDLSEPETPLGRAAHSLISGL
jgi:arylformamidase